MLYNRRYGHQGIVAALARIAGDDWIVDERSWCTTPSARATAAVRDGGVDEMLDFEFGFPTATARRDGSYLVTYWAVLDGRCGARWASLRIDP